MGAANGDEVWMLPCRQEQIHLYPGREEAVDQVGHYPADAPGAGAKSDEGKACHASDSDAKGSVGRATGYSLVRREYFLVGVRVVSRRPSPSEHPAYQLNP